jgi:hypothetical protein
VGREVVCVVRYKGRAAEGKTLRETSELVFRSPELRLRIPFGQIGSVAADEGELVVGWSEGEARFEIGAREAERWAKAIANPPSLLDKLGVKAGHRVSLLNAGDAAFRIELAKRAGEVVDGQPAEGSDLVLFGVEEPAELARLAELRGCLKPNGAIWVVSPKGRRDLRDVDVYAAGKAAGLVDVKVAAFSATHTANKLVIPLAQRG